MKFADKIIKLRKENGLSQEDLADKLNISRQAISRWESDSVLPDATNILQLSKLFNVSCDYLLNDEYKSQNINTHNNIEQNTFLIMYLLITLQLLIFIAQFICVVILKNIIFSFLSFIPSITTIGAFETLYQKNKDNEKLKRFRYKFYKISIWIGTYCPIRFMLLLIMNLYPRPVSMFVFNGVTLIIYLIVAILMIKKLNKSII